MNNATKSFIQGYACAVATLQRMDGSEIYTTQVKELSGAGGLTLENCQKAGVDAYDMEILFPKLNTRPENVT